MAPCRGLPRWVGNKPRPSYHECAGCNAWLPRTNACVQVVRPPRPSCQPSGELSRATGSRTHCGAGYHRRRWDDRVGAGPEVVLQQVPMVLEGSVEFNKLCPEGQKEAAETVCLAPSRRAQNVVEKHLKGHPEDRVLALSVLGNLPQGHCRRGETHVLTLLPGLSVRDPLPGANGIAAHWGPWGLRPSAILHVHRRLPSEPGPTPPCMMAEFLLPPAMRAAAQVLEWMRAVCVRQVPRGRHQASKVGPAERRCAMGRCPLYAATRWCKTRWRASPPSTLWKP